MSAPCRVTSSAPLGSPGPAITRTSRCCPALASRLRTNRPLPSSSASRRRPISSKIRRSTGRASGSSSSPLAWTARSASAARSAGRVAGELHPDAEARVQAGVGGQERLHLPLVAGQDDDQVLAVVLSTLDQRLHGLVTEPVALPVALVHQAVGLVDEQHGAERRVDELVGLDRGRAEVLPDQVGALRLDHDGRAQQAEGVEDLRDHPGDRCLAGARRPEEDEVLHRLLGAVPGDGAPPGRLHRGGDGPHLILDGGQADHRVELGHRVIDGDVGPVGRAGILRARPSPWRAQSVPGLCDADRRSRRDRPAARVG